MLKISIASFKGKDSVVLQLPELLLLSYSYEYHQPGASKVYP